MVWRLCRLHGPYDVVVVLCARAPARLVGLPARAVRLRGRGVPGARLRVLPETIDFDLYDPAGLEPWPLDGIRGFTFLTNFDFTDRKGWDLLLDTWARAFAPDDDVCLVLKCLSLHGLGDAEIREKIERRLAGRPTAPVLIVTGVLPMASLPAPH